MNMAYKKLLRAAVPTVILLIGIMLMILGILRGELQQIYQKAIIICLECIAIG